MSPTLFTRLSFSFFLLLTFLFFLFNDFLSLFKLYRIFSVSLLFLSSWRIFLPFFSRFFSHSQLMFLIAEYSVQLISDSLKPFSKRTIPSDLKSRSEEETQGGRLGHGSSSGGFSCPRHWMSGRAMISSSVNCFSACSSLLSSSSRYSFSTFLFLLSVSKYSIPPPWWWRNPGGCVYTTGSSSICSMHKTVRFRNIFEESPQVAGHNCHGPVHHLKIYSN